MAADASFHPDKQSIPINQVLLWLSEKVRTTNWKFIRAGMIQRFSFLFLCINDWKERSRLEKAQFARVVKLTNRHWAWRRGRQILFSQLSPFHYLNISSPSFVRLHCIISPKAPSKHRYNRLILLLQSLELVTHLWCDLSDIAHQASLAADYRCFVLLRRSLHCLEGEGGKGSTDQYGVVSYSPSIQRQHSPYSCESLASFLCSGEHEG